MAADQRMPTPTSPLSPGPNGQQLNQLDWAKNPLGYRFEIVAMTPQIMNKVYDVLDFDANLPGNNDATGVVTRIDLKINPQRYRLHEGTRQNVTQTVAGAWVDAYGLGLPKIGMTGTTGWNPKRKKTPNMSLGAALAAVGNAVESVGTGISAFAPQIPQPTGLQDIVELRNSIFRLYAVLVQEIKVDSSERIQNLLQLRFYAWDTQDYFVVLIDDFELNRSATRPMMYDYDIQMTVLGYINGRQDLQDDLAQYFNPISRLGAALNALNNFIGSVEGVINAVQNVEATIASDIRSVTTLVTQLTNAVTAVVTGVESFVDLPFTVLNQITTALRSIADDVVAVETLPQDFANNLRAQLLETTCSIYALGTYPALFQQTASDTFATAPWANLGCSSTMGVPPSPISLDQGVSIPGVPASPAALPTSMTFPTPPVAVSSAAARPSVAVKNNEVSIQEGDTIESVIAKNGGLDPDVAKAWQQIATLNGLEYPYIAPNSEFVTNIYATGSVTFYGAPGTVVPEGTRVAYTPPSGNPIYYDTDASVTLGSNGQGLVSVTAEAAGDVSNVGALQITEIFDALGNLLTIAGITSVSNGSDVSGGKIWQVLKPGDKLVLPVAANTEVQEPYLERTGVTDSDLFGIDIALDETGDFIADATGDLAVVAGIANMEVAVINRLTTETGEMIKHPEYGLDIPRLVGEPGDQMAGELMKLEMKGTLLQDPRITNVTALTVGISTADQTLSVKANLSLISGNSSPIAAVSPI